jgi:hypothetical protein
MPIIVAGLNSSSTGASSLLRSSSSEDLLNAPSRRTADRSDDPPPSTYYLNARDLEGLFDLKIYRVTDAADGAGEISRASSTGDPKKPTSRRILIGQQYYPEEDLKPKKKIRTKDIMKRTIVPGGQESAINVMLKRLARLKHNSSAVRAHEVRASKSSSQLISS